MGTAPYFSSKNRALSPFSPIFLMCSVTACRRLREQLPQLILWWRRRESNPRPKT